jgi:O-antigen/teichoic acid export membrane protein
MMEAVSEQNTILQEVRTAVRHMAVYGIGNILVKAVGFVMLPFYTHYFSPKDYGILEILDLSMSLFALVLNMGLTPAFLRVYAAADSPEGRRHVVSTGCIFGIVTGLATFLVGVGFVGPATHLLFGPGVPSTYILLSLSALVLNYMANLPRTYLRALEASGAFTIVDTVSVFLLLALNIWFIAVMKVGLVGVLLSSVIVAALQFLGLSVWAFRRSGFGFRVAKLRYMLGFGVPLILANVGLFVLNFSDRYFLQHLRSLEVVGVYAVGYKFGFMMNYLFVQPFFVMWQSRMYAVHANPEHRNIYRQFFAMYSLGLFFAGLAMALFSPEVIRLMVEPRFAAGQDIVPIVVLAYVFYGLGYYAQLGMLLTDRTKLIGAIGAAAAALNLVLNYFLISKFGMIGAAWATLISFAAIAGGCYWGSQRVFPLPLGLGRMWSGLLLAVALYLPFRLWTPLGFGGTVALKLAALAAFPLLAWKTGILPPSVTETMMAATNRFRLRSRELVKGVAVGR